MSADDLQSLGWLLADCGRQGLIRSVGTRIWQRWAQEIAKGKHPKRADLLAFLRGWGGPAQDWLPFGMAEYLADRLDPDVDTPDAGGRPPASYRDKLERWTQDANIAIAVHSQWQTHREAGVPYPQRTALEDVARAMNLPEATVRLAFNRCRACAQAVAIFGHQYTTVTQGKSGIVLG